jgi:hypothetical protein
MAMNVNPGFTQQPHIHIHRLHGFIGCVASGGGGATPSGHAR